MNARVGFASSWWTGRSGGGACTTHRQGATAVPEPPPARSGLRARAEPTLLAVVLLLFATPGRLAAQPTVFEPGLAVRPLVTGLTLPTSMAFIGANDLLVLEKNSGQVKRVTDGVVQGTVLDLAVNSISERGLLGIAVDPAVPTNVYLYWTESSSGSDSNAVGSVSLLGNRIDRFVWDGSSLTFASAVARFRCRQTDNVEVTGHPGTANGAEASNHDGGVLRFGPDGKLYVFVGDLGRRGWMQNLPTGPFSTDPFVDDTFGGPAPDNAHLSGVVLRLNTDGTAPADNPFFAAGGAIGGEAGANVQKIFSYGHRNGFGMAFDPLGTDLWLSENGDDAFSELNRVTPGSNGGWVQIMGPVGRIAEFKSIETTFGTGNLQQVRWPPSNIAAMPAEALSRLFMLPGASYSDPALSWKWEVSPGAIVFLDSTALGVALRGDLFVGAATALLRGGYLFRLDLSAARTSIAVTDPRLNDGVADNLAKHEITESESLLFGTGFGTVTDIETGPNGNLFLVSLSNGAIYEIFNDGSATGPTTPGTKQQLRCQNGTGKIIARFARAKARCVAKCLATARKAGGPFTDCRSPYGGATAACIQDPDTGAEAKARLKIAKACAKDCPACYATGGNCPAGASFVAEAESRFDALAPRIFCLEADGTPPTRQEARCEDAVSKTLVKFLASKTKCVGRCVTSAFKGKIDVATCAAGAVSDPTTQACIAKAEGKAVAAIDEACAPVTGTSPACHTDDGTAWVAGVEAEVDAQSPLIFCGP